MRLKNVLYLLGLTVLVSLLSFPGRALEIDEKLTTRVLKTSKTKKTILINRGLEDGLVVGDHAKFFLTSGVLARGEVVKAAPTRTIWSIYRIIKPEQLYGGAVMNLKITKPIDLTKDRTRDIQKGERGGPIQVPDSVKVAAGADDLPEGFDDEGLSQEEQSEIEGLRPEQGGASSAPVGTGQLMKNWELWGLVSFNSLSSSSELADGSSVSGSTSNIDLTAGLEVYRLFDGEFFRPISFTGFFHKATREVSTVVGSQVSLDSFGYGGGVHYHFLHDPMSYGKFIAHAGVNMAMGSSTDQVTFDNGTQTVEGDTLEGNYTSISLAAGLKFYLPSGIGFRGMLDYYQRSESYSLDDGSEYTRTLAGPRFQVGLAYRW